VDQRPKKNAVQEKCPEFFVNGVEDVMTTVIALFEDKKYRTLKLK